MAAAAILKITLLAMSAITVLHIFVPSLMHRLKLGLTARFTVKIHISQKSKMAAAAILKYGHNSAIFEPICT